jgi:hypothetical protein
MDNVEEGSVGADPTTVEERGRCQEIFDSCGQHGLSMNYCMWQRMAYLSKTREKDIKILTYHCSSSFVLLHVSMQV